MSRFSLRRVISLLCASGVMMTPIVHAAAFQLWEQDGASVANYHAGYAALAEDASIAFYNPAGITRIKNQQIVFAGATVLTDFKYQGTIAVNTILDDEPRSTTAQGGDLAFVPALHYVAPLSDDLGFGFSIAVPFGLASNYGTNSLIRYAATQSSIMVIDISPALGYQITKKASFGAGFDIQRLYAQFNQSGGSSYPTLEANSRNVANDTGYGGHIGALYQFSDDSRLGLSYHSQVVHHVNGSSSFTGPFANTDIVGGPFSSQAYVNITLPPYTALSAYHKAFTKWGFMGSAIYTQWDVIRTLTLNNVSAILDAEPSKNVQVVIPQYFRNTWNFSVGANYDATDKIVLKGGLGYDQTPVRNAYRNVQMPDNNRVVVACGGHYQATNAVGLDVSWMHLFIPQSGVDITQPEGDEQVTTNGNFNGGADVFSAQLTWNIL